jgi:hypothetical protein
MVSVVLCFERVTTLDPGLVDEMAVRSLRPLKVSMDTFGRSFFDGGGVRGAWDESEASDHLEPHKSMHAHRRST